MHRGGLDRFKKAQSIEPFSVTLTSSSKPTNQAAAQPNHLENSNQHTHSQHQRHGTSNFNAPDAVAAAKPSNQVGGSQSNWQPPDWAIDPRAGVYYLEVVKDGDTLDRINLDKKRHIFGRQTHTCDFVLDHQSVSRQHAAVIPHKNGSIYVIDLGSVHGTFVGNERLVKDTPIELEVGQSLRFAASTRIYILRKNDAVLFPTPSALTDVKLPSPPDPSDDDAVVAYNTILNRYGFLKSNLPSKSESTRNISSKDQDSSRPSKKIKKGRVSFKDHIGGSLVEVVGISDGVDVETEPGPIGVKEGSLVGKYESLVQVTVIPKGKEQLSQREDSISPKGVSHKLQEVLNKIKSTAKGGIYDDIYADSLTGMPGSSWAYKKDDKDKNARKIDDLKPPDTLVEDRDDLFGD